MMHGQKNIKLLHYSYIACFASATLSLMGENCVQLTFFCLWLCFIVYFTLLSEFQNR